MNACDRRADLGPYVLGNLPDDERADVEAHLAVCAGCRRELAELDELPSLLARAAEPVPRPPERVRDRVLAAAVARRVRRRWTAVAAAVAVVAALLGGTVASLFTPPSPSVAVGLTAVEPFEPEGWALLEDSRDGIAVRLEISDLPALPRGEVYEAWLSTHDEELVSLGHLRPDGAGAVAATLRAGGSVDGYRSFWVTAEPDATSSHDGPTVVYARLPSADG